MKSMNQAGPFFGSTYPTITKRAGWETLNTSLSQEQATELMHYGNRLTPVRDSKYIQIAPTDTVRWSLLPLLHRNALMAELLVVKSLLLMLASTSSQRPRRWTSHDRSNSLGQVILEPSQPYVCNYCLAHFSWAIFAACQANFKTQPSSRKCLLKSTPIPRSIVFHRTLEIARLALDVSLHN